MLDWRDMGAFKGVDLNDSWVLSWEKINSNLVFQIEASLWPGHPQYAEPEKSDWTCYRKATLTFSRTRRTDGLRPMSDAPTTTDPDGSFDYGCIDTLEQKADGSFLICGDFGDVTIESEGLIFDVT